jgi:hypothetical protein
MKQEIRFSKKKQTCIKCSEPLNDSNCRITTKKKALRKLDGVMVLYRAYRQFCKSCQDKIVREKTFYLRDYQRKYQKNPKNKVKIDARRMFHKALKTGQMIKEDKCEQCDSKSNIEAHHPDYNFPLQVMWLCKKCHFQEDKNNATH